ncbi:MAG: right-handed parallel beta-helix repeat-containing protein [Thermodesulfobacteriota bacterium]
MEDDLTPLPYGVENGRRVLYITYKGDCRMVHVNGQDLLFTTRTLTDALSCVRPGDILQLLPGKYWPPILYDEDACGTPACRPIKMYELEGWPEAPITIRGMGAATLLDGGLGGVPHDSMLPEMKHFAYFKLKDCAWIEFENFHVENCWPTFLYIEDSTYVTVRGVKAKDSRYMVYARGQSTHHILLEDNLWRQDPTGSMWRDLLWLDSKRKRYFYYNGGIFGSYGISGSVVLRNNVICDAFNGMRMKADKKKIDSQNHNVEIYGNTMLRTRDNPVEPESGATNWWVHHNRIHNAHAWFSLDEVAGGFWYYFANTGWITDKPGSMLDPNRGGKVYKYDVEGPYPSKDRPTFFFNNSYCLYNSLIKDGVTANMLHVNNAVLFRDELPPAAPQKECAPCNLPEAVRRPFPDGNYGKDRFMGPGFMPKGWDPSVAFDCDLTNLPWPPKVTENAQEKNGICDPKAAFADPDAGDLRLSGGPPKGCHMTLEAGVDWPAPENWSSGPDTPIGAYGFDAGLVEGPAFAFLVPKTADGGYKEMPRLVRLSVQEGALVLTFSTPLAGETAKVRVKAGQDKFWTAAVISGRVMTVALPAPLAGRRLKKVWLPDTLTGANGEFATLWSSVFEGLRFYQAGAVPRTKPPKPVCFCNCGEEI